MANSNAADASNKFVAIDRQRSVLAEDIRIEGNIVSQGVLDFGGQITGNLTADAVILTSTARVQGRIRARTLTIEGDLRGAATALNISVKKGAHVRANVAYETLEVALGANITGQYKRISGDTFKLWPSPPMDRQAASRGSCKHSPPLHARQRAIPVLRSISERLRQAGKHGPYADQPPHPPEGVNALFP